MYMPQMSVFNVFRVENMISKRQIYLQTWWLSLFEKVLLCWLRNTHLRLQPMTKNSMVQAAPQTPSF